MAHESEADDRPEEMEEDVEFWDAIEAAGASGDPERMAWAERAVLARAWEWTEDHPSPQVDRLCEGHRLAEAGDWMGAEAAYRDALAMAEGPFDELQPRRHLASLCANLGRHEDALAEAGAATDAARRVGWETVLAMALRTEGRHAREAGDLPAAIAGYTEGLAVLPEDSIQTLLRAMILVGRAGCFAEAGDLPAAEEDLSAAWPILEPATEAFCAAGVMATLSAWWDATARVRQAHGDPAGAVDAGREAVRYRRRAAESPPAFLRTALADALQSLGEALLAAGDEAGAEEALAEGRQIRRELGLPEAGARSPV